MVRDGAACAEKEGPLRPRTFDSAVASALRASSIARALASRSHWWRRRICGRLLSLNAPTRMRRRASSKCAPSVLVRAEGGSLATASGSLKAEPGRFLLEGLAAGELVESLSHAFDAGLSAQAVALGDSSVDHPPSRFGGAHCIVVADGGEVELVPGNAERFGVSVAAPWPGLVGLALQVS